MWHVNRPARWTDEYTCHRYCPRRPQFCAPAAAESPQSSAASRPVHRRHAGAAHVATAPADSSCTSITNIQPYFTFGVSFTNLGFPVKVTVKVHTLDIAPLCSEYPPQKRTGTARVLKAFHSFTCTSTHSSAIGMSHTCLCLTSYNWYSFTDPGGMEG